MEPSDLSKAVDMNTRYLGVDCLVLMENAGRKVAERLDKFQSIAVFAGLGNNGGDGLVAARHLSAKGKKVAVFSLQGKRSRECQINFDVIQRLDSIEVKTVGDSSDCREIDLSGFDAVVDSLLGVGVRGEPREPAKSLVSAMNAAKAFKLAVDCPTPGFKADATLSFHFAKARGAEVADIGIPREAESFCGPGDFYLAFPRRLGGEHKGAFGKIVVVGGSRDYSLTPMLVGRAALRTGADLAVLCSPSYAAGRMSSDPNLIVRPLSSESYLDKADVDVILGLGFDCLVVGNGLSVQEATRHAVKKLVKEVEKPMVLDADALKLVKPRHLRENMILTPHAGEFESLFGEKPEDAKAAVEEFSKKHGCCVVLKGAIDMVSDGKETKLNRTGNPGMTVGGTGDVLAGIIGALACRAEPFRAAAAGAFLSGLAGDLAFEEYGFSLLATDCIEKIPEAIRYCGEYI